MAVAGIFERLSGGNNNTANRLKMLLLLDALTGLARISPALILQTGIRVEGLGLARISPTLFSYYKLIEGLGFRSGSNLPGPLLILQTN
jgi:hypothetical protein